MNKLSSVSTWRTLISLCEFLVPLPLPLWSPIRNSEHAESLEDQERRCWLKRLRALHHGMSGRAPGKLQSRDKLSRVQRLSGMCKSMPGEGCSPHGASPLADAASPLELSSGGVDPLLHRDRRRHGDRQLAGLPGIRRLPAPYTHGPLPRPLSRRSLNFLSSSLCFHMESGKE